jgi:nucleoside 2-deoxyribosyltransferase
MQKKMVYIAGDMLNRGAQLQRAEERDAIKALGFDLYCPQDNKEINDKQNAVQEGLAERIVRHDTDAIMRSDIIVFEPLLHAVGTNIELGQVKGVKDDAKAILNIIAKSKGGDAVEILKEVTEHCLKMLDKKVYVHYSDIRRHDIPEVGDRRSFGPHQYMYGVTLDLTDGVGFMPIGSILEDMARRFINV